MIYKNISSRYQVFGNAFRMCDFMGRQLLSFDDFFKGLNGFGI